MATPSNREHTPTQRAAGGDLERLRQRSAASGPREDETMELPSGQRQAVRIAVVIPASSRDDIADTLASVVRYTDPSK